MLKLHIFSALFISLVYSAPLNSDALVDVTSCLKEFYQAAYSGEYNCTEKFDFFSNDAVTQKNTYTLGKDCFLSVIQGECSKAQYSSITKNYEQIAETITEEPEDETSCTGLHYTYNALKCTPMMKDFFAIAFDMPKMNDPKLLGMIDLCDKMQTCMSPTCYYPEETKKQIKISCEGFHMMNSPFSDCMTNLQTHPPRSSKYSCLNGRDFNAKGMETGIEMLTTYRECIKEIMKDSCGEEALENFDEYADISVKGLQKMKALTGVLYEK
ncbi:hypothetical protein CAEBREN_01367 [Caenorhabditis brenneri]|uniref:T20D4.11-like domain-containing protein n=1 Tax=Caenorhabditis brenneri TaxID=135651 RepID=G0M9W5_CAEBE|nr:hypothetical protein CAEBREN_01367 [Caenorhabditis brenneri]